MPIYLDDGPPDDPPAPTRLSWWRLWRLAWRLNRQTAQALRRSSASTAEWAATPAPAPLMTSPTPSAAEATGARGVHRCRTCDYARLGEGGVRECRRRPPSIISLDEDGGYVTVWPRVEDFEWCGEFRAAAHREQ